VIPISDKGNNFLFSMSSRQCSDQRHIERNKIFLNILHFRNAKFSSVMGEKPFCLQLVCMIMARWTETCF
jgi:hypothetical protein